MVTTMGLVFVLLASPPATAEFERALRSPDSLQRARAVYVATRTADLSRDRTEITDRMRRGDSSARAAVVRGVGLRNYGGGTPPQWVQTLIVDALSDRDEKVRESAALAIAHLRFRSAIPAVAKALDEETRKPSGDSFRRALLAAAGRLNDPGLGKAVLASYEANAGGTRVQFPLHASPSTAFLAASADLNLEIAREFVARNYRILEVPDDKTLVSNISATMTDEGKATMAIYADPVLRMWTARAAAVIVDDPSLALSQIKDVLDGPTATHRLEAAWALASFPESRDRTQAVAMLATAGEDQYGPVREVVVRTLASDGVQLGILAQGLDDPYPDLRTEAALGLAEAGAIGSNRAAMKKALETEKDPIVRQAWTFALAQHDASK